MVTDAQIIDEILEREGWNGPDYLDKADAGGRTTWGISERAHPEAWIDGPPTIGRCRQIYEEEYVKPFDWMRELEYDQLRVQMIDIAVNSGHPWAIRLLQRVIGVHDDGKAGPVTKAALRAAGAPRMICNALVAFRLKFVDDITDAKASQKRFEEGWENRALSFIQ
jgi:lysozyme family protein